MKNIVSIILLSMLCITANAQFSVGARTGLSCWKSVYLGNADNKIANKGNTPVWDKQIYARYQTKGRFAFEAGFGHYKMNQKSFGNDIITGCFTPYIPLNYTETHDFLEYNLSAQYDISCPAIPCLKSYIGVMLSPTMRYSNVTYTSKHMETGELETYSSNHQSLNIYTGLSHYMEYCISKHLNINSQASFRIDPSTFFSQQFSPAYYEPNTRFSWQLGMGYEF